MSRRTGRPSYLLSASPPRRRRLSWLAVVAAIGLVVALVGGGIGYAVGRPDATESTVADLRRAEAKRDTQQITELTATARRLREEIAPVLDALRAEPAADARQAREWQQTLRRAAEPFANPPSGTTATNVARGGLRGAVEQTSLAVESYLLAVTGPPAQRAALTALAKRQADQAAAAWSVAATQLDQVNVDAGHGHQHVYLEGDQHDGAEEGTGG
ncbi:hypothetical protein FJK98_20985 [Micromonospora sp. HM134]|uniref:hypothetical protein n=1 Tax=Micromonospora sp. HM134 TaxID=2583243 RepID=UPI001198A510|nr:hypothetical protein [Micromonospora sp. HM134]QDY09329.1 hypothetical protein FJK98_20985 [Micromonospora sp. HM134]